MRALHLPVRLMVLVVTVAALLMFGAPSASAHVEGEASTAHVLLELVRWAAAIVAVLTAILAAFWLRARALRRSRQ